MIIARFPSFNCDITKCSRIQQIQHACTEPAVAWIRYHRTQAEWCETPFQTVAELHLLIKEY